MSNTIERFKPYEGLTKDIENDTSIRRGIKNNLINRLLFPQEEPLPDGHELTLPIPAVIINVPTATVFEWHRSSDDIVIDKQYDIYLLSPFKTDVAIINQTIPMGNYEVNHLFSYNGFCDEMSSYETQLSTQERYVMCEIFFNLFIRYARRSFYGSPMDLAYELKKNYETIRRNYLGYNGNRMHNRMIVPNYFELITDTVAFDATDARNIFENMFEDIKDTIIDGRTYAKKLEKTMPKEIFWYMHQSNQLWNGVKTLQKIIDLYHEI